MPSSTGRLSHDDYHDILRAIFSIWARMLPLKTSSATGSQENRNLARAPGDGAPGCAPSGARGTEELTTRPSGLFHGTEKASPPPRPAGRKTGMLRSSITNNARNWETLGTIGHEGGRDGTRSEVSAVCAAQEAFCPNHIHSERTATKLIHTYIFLPRTPAHFATCFPDLLM